MVTCRRLACINKAPKHRRNSSTCQLIFELLVPPDRNALKKVLQLNSARLCAVSLTQQPRILDMRLLRFSLHNASPPHKVAQARQCTLTWSSAICYLIAHVGPAARWGPETWLPARSNTNCGEEHTAYVDIDDISNTTAQRRYNGFLDFTFLIRINPSIPPL
jgi:hypothetical protein